MKRNLIVLSLLIAVATVFAIGGGGAFAETPTADFAQDCASYYLIDYNTGTVMSAKAENERRPIASMVKIMTLLLGYEAVADGRISLEQEVVVSEKAASMGGSQMFLEAGDVYNLHDIFKGITVVSANDASVLLAETISGSVENFVAAMNEKASAIGMENTLFVNCTGLPESGQYSTAKDVSVMMRALLTHPEYYQFSKVYLEEYNHPDGRVTEFVNTNKLIRFYSDCDGGKTGFTNDAMFCLSATAKRDDLRVIATVLGGATSKARFSAVSQLFNFAFANYEVSTVIDTSPIVNDIIVEGGKQSTITVAPESELKVLKNKNDKDSLSIEITLDESISAPISAGQKVGQVKVVDKLGNIVAETAVISLDNIIERTYWDALLDVMENWNLLS